MINMKINNFAHNLHAITHTAVWRDPHTSLSTDRCDVSSRDLHPVYRQGYTVLVPEDHHGYRIHPSACGAHPWWVGDGNELCVILSLSLAPCSGHDQSPWAGAHSFVHAWARPRQCHRGVGFSDLHVCIRLERSTVSVSSHSPVLECLHWFQLLVVLGARSLATLKRLHCRQSYTPHRK